MAEKSLEFLKQEMVMKRLAAMTVVITVDGVEKRLNLGSLGPLDDRICEQQLGNPLVYHLQPLLAGRLSLSALAAMWWIARRHDTEPHLTFEQACEGFPTLGDFSDRIAIDVLSGDDEEAAVHPEG